MTSSLNVIALISGGKDSLYTLLHCLHHGHKLIALANLYPQHDSQSSACVDPDHPQEGEDLNSFMYQTVGHSLVPLYSQCLELPLYRRAISGKAVQTGRYYDPTKSALDETEDLIPLLQEVKRNHPQANAICAGAILSTYQRTRVESVAIRLGLTPLAYLWQYPALPPPQGRADSICGLLQDMAAVGCDARIIKIASGGIPERLLWANVGDNSTLTRLVNGLSPFFPDREFWLRGAVLGEGGEYETIAINGPRPLWKNRIDIAETNSLTIADEGGVSYFKIAGAKLADKCDCDDTAVHDQLRIPDGLDPQFAILGSLVEASLQPLDPSAELPTALSNPNFDAMIIRASATLSAGNLVISNITIDPSDRSKGMSSSAADQMKGVVQKLREMLQSYHGQLKLVPTTSNIVSTTLLLQDISHFGVVNSIYATLFREGEPNPPARVTFACRLPPGVEVSLSVVLNLGSRDSLRGLHVQSRSYWAPANIGPYSQAVCEPLDDPQDPNCSVHDEKLIEIVHVAGQIPLVPQSMEVKDGSFIDQAVLSLQHLWRIGQEREVDVWPWGVALYKSQSEPGSRASAGCELWRHAHLTGTKPGAGRCEDDGHERDDLDAWDLQFNRSAGFQSNLSRVTVGEHLHVLPDPGIFLVPPSPEPWVPPYISAAVTALPRDAPIEWWSLGVAHLPKSPNSHRRATVCTQRYPWGSLTVLNIKASLQEEGTGWPSTRHGQTDFATVLVTENFESSSLVDGLRNGLNEVLCLDPNAQHITEADFRTVHGTAFIAQTGEDAWRAITKQTLFSGLSIVPCTSLFGRAFVQPFLDPASNRSTSTLPLTSDGTDPGCQRLALAMTIRLEARVET
ncbi:hypothetical protein PV10_01978 [Exophiala mesophila]|uniref:Diphthine--ammonia ligase n=1 Tax=Exophiala mesophila TaxID=212818 RepID=A0A0D1ZJR3_EXOME|nr:uncharacterized protein PV10_01978 [Exophiala mesophila]KIV94189.1 hypothetical protein PV10_01978 [Exophiala mesophila]